MEVDKILRNGYFDRLRIDGNLKPVCDYTGTVIKNGASFKELLNQSEDGYKHGIAELKLKIIGEATRDESQSRLSDLRESRKQASIIQLDSLPNWERYLVAYACIFIIKSDYAIPYELKNRELSDNSIGKFAKTEDKVELITEALKVRGQIINEYNYPAEYVNIAVVDKVYVAPAFRRCRVSSWIHTNLSDMINLYSLVFPNAVLLAYGDFSDEADTMFNMSKKAYSNMLYKHYTSLGYKRVPKISIPIIEQGSNIMYKLLV